MNWGEHRVYFHNDAGELTALPASWTSVFPEDPVVALFEGRLAFRCHDLLALAELLERLQDVASDEVHGDTSDVSI